jgi:hypothetical protein
MESHFKREPDSPVRAVEREVRSFRRIQGGDAAKAAEQSTEGSATYQGAFGMNLRATRGARFELEKEPKRQGEALPLPSADSGSPVLPTTSDEQQAVEPAGITKKLFRRLFRP